MLDIKNHLSHLVAYTEDRDEMAKKFDLLVYQLETAILKGEKNQRTLISNFVQIGNMLWKKRNIPSIKQKETSILEIKSEEFWSSVNLARLEHIRTEIRDLMQLLKDDDKEKPIYSYFEDVLDHSSVKEVDLLENYTSLQSYKDRVEYFIKKNRHHLVVDKLYRNIAITPTELKILEDFLNHEKFKVEDIEKEYGKIPLGIFVRKILGLDIEAANQHFADFIQNENLTANQMLFVQKIIDYLTKNGVLEKHMLTQPPFTDIDDQGIFGIFEDNTKTAKIIKLIEEIRENAEIA